MHILLGIVEDKLSKYPTCLSQDVADLLDEHAYPQFSNCRHAKIQVRGEKKVLHHYRQWAMAALHVMEIMEAECTGRDGESFEQVIAKKSCTTQLSGIVPMCWVLCGEKN